MEIITNIALISINETLLVQLISFLVFMVILNRVMVRPLRRSAEERTTYIENLGTEIVDAQKEMKSIAVQIENQESEARRAAREIQEDIVAQGSQEASGILAAAKQDVVALRQQTQAEIEATLQEFRKTLAREAEIVAVNFMEKALNRRLHP